ncbi:hypothetical protein [Caulobacter radicis]|uniref:hypothetical protein n=1 Tax=Caulobacter radicis TaxID=2172650 RepID=UPI001AD82AD9|nr:hypothetical protein [Caulobacter radicis]
MLELLDSISGRSRVPVALDLADQEIGAIAHGQVQDCVGADVGIVLLEMDALQAGDRNEFDEGF